MPEHTSAIARLRRWDWLSFGLLLLLYGLSLWVLLARPMTFGVSLIEDDSYYYLGIARNLVESGHGVFLPPTGTNGYQPLWLLLLTGGARVFGTADKAMVLQALSWCLLFTVAFAALSRRRYGFATPAVLVALIFPSVMAWGMETAMMPLWWLAYGMARRWWWRGALASLMFLTRLDALVLILAWEAFRQWRGARDLRHYLVLVPVMAGYFALNQWLYGVPVPISGLSKTVGNHPGENLFLVYGYFSGYRLALGLGVALVASSLLTQGWPRRRTPPGSVAVRPPAFAPPYAETGATLAAGVACGLYYGVFSGWPTWPWYSWPILLATYHVLVIVVQRLALTLATPPARAFSPARMAAIGLLLGGLLASLFVARRPLGYIRNLTRAEPPASYALRNAELAARIRAGLWPAGTSFAMGDRAGSLGFLLGARYRFLHTEGLVGDRAYYEALKADRGADYFHAHRPDYLVADRDRFFVEGNVIGVAEPVQGMSAHTGPYLLCYPRAAVRLNQNYAWQGAPRITQRYVFDARQEVTCPRAMQADFLQRRERYGGLLAFSVPKDGVAARNRLTNGLGHLMRLPPDR